MASYSGGCHCGNVKYDVNLELGKVVSCNCSMCGKKGTLLTFVPANAFTLKSGEAALTSYKFNHHIIDHLFCSTCGVTSFARGMKGGEPMVAINARCLEGVDVDKLDLQHFDGKSR